MKTTLKKIRDQSPCKEGWEKLLNYLGKTKADDEQLPLLTVLDSNGLDDALWCMRAIEGRDKEIRLYAVWCARQVQHLMPDPSSLEALDVAEKFANGEATAEDLAEARTAARDAACDASCDASCDAARDALWAAASAASWAVDSAEVWAVANAAARAAAMYAESGAAGAAVRAAQASRLREVCNEVQKVKQ